MRQERGRVSPSWRTLVFLLVMPVLFMDASAEKDTISTEQRQSIRRIDQGNGDSTPGQAETQKPAGDPVIVDSGIKSANETDSQPNDGTATIAAPAAASGTDSAITSAPSSAPSIQDAGAETKKSPEEIDTGAGAETKKSPEDDNTGPGGEEGGGHDEKTPEPTPAPKRATPAPVISPTAPPVTENVPDGGDKGSSTTTDPCLGATTCEACTEKAAQLDSTESTCWWTDGAGCVKETKEAHESLKRCPNEVPPSSAGWDDDSESMLPLISGLVGLLIVIFLLFRKLYGGRLLAGDRASVEHGKYQGLSMAEKDDDEEWGWDDEPQPRRNRQVEMVQTTPRSSGNGSAYHRRSRSPNSSTDGNSMGLYPVSGSPGNNSAAPQPKRGLTVKRSGGLKNPLHAKQESAPPSPPTASPPRQVRPAAPVVKKQAVKADDFFEDFGFSSSSSSKPKTKLSVAASKPSSGLGATRLTASVLEMMIGATMT